MVSWQINAPSKKIKSLGVLGCRRREFPPALSRRESRLSGLRRGKEPVGGGRRLNPPRWALGFLPAPFIIHPASGRRVHLPRFKSEPQRRAPRAGSLLRAGADWGGLRVRTRAAGGGAAAAPAGHSPARVDLQPPELPFPS